MEDQDKTYFWLVIICFLGLAAAIGRYMAGVYAGDAGLAGRILAPLERAIYRIGRVRADEEMDWPAYAEALLVFNLAGERLEEINFPQTAVSSLATVPRDDRLFLGGQDGNIRILHLEELESLLRK
jgi:hypothetical protein